MKTHTTLLTIAALLTSVGTVHAYSDVSEGVWYKDAVDAFVEDGYLDGTKAAFRGEDKATRAEFVKLVVELNGGILESAPVVATFDDVKTGDWMYGYIEEAAKESWVRGDGNCVGTHPCYAHPTSPITRAEAATLIVRAFSLDATNDAPSFIDVPAGDWYTDAVQTAADHCVIRGDAATGWARPMDSMNRAEMVAMLHRVDFGVVYDGGCEY